MLNHSRIIPEADPGPQRDSRLRIPGLILTLFLLFQPGLGSGMKSNSSGIPALEGAAGTTPNPGFPVKFHGGKAGFSPAHPKHVFNPKLGKKNPGKGQDSKQGCSQKKWRCSHPQIPGIGFFQAQNSLFSTQIPVGKMLWLEQGSQSMNPQPNS